MRVVYLFVLLAKSQGNVIWSLSVNVHHTPDSERRFLLVRKRCCTVMADSGGSVNILSLTSFALLRNIRRLFLSFHLKPELHCILWTRFSQLMLRFIFGPGFCLLIRYTEQWPIQGAV